MVINMELTRAQSRGLPHWVGGVRGAMSISVKSSGWRVRRLKADLLNTVDASNASTGASLGGTYVERSGEGKAPGGSRGSFAVAVAPCDIAGTGTLQLSGGSAPVSVSCPPLGAGVPLDFSTAKRKTMWHLRGTVVGVSSFRERLVVFSLPAQ